MVSKIRAQRIADRMHQMLSEMLQREVSDPRLQGVYVTGVDIDREMTAANVYVSALEGRARSAEILAGLQHASGYLRSELARRIDLRNIPRLQFHWDPTPENADHIERLFAQLRKEKENQQNDNPSTENETEA